MDSMAEFPLKDWEGYHERMELSLRRARALRRLEQP